MVSRGSSKSQATEILKETKDVVLKNPVVLLLFFILSIIDLISFVVLFLSHSFPFSKVLAPIIRRFWGDRFLHYPDNLFLLPKLCGYAHVLMLSTFGLIVTAIVIKLIQNQIENTKVTALEAAGIGLKKYFWLALTWVSSFFALRFIGRGLTGFIGDSVLVQIVVFWFVFLLFQSLISFIFPAIVTAQRGFIRPVLTGLVTAIKNYGLLIKLLFVPVGISVGISFMKAFAPAYIKINPEIIIFVMVFSIFVSVAVDLYITTVTAVSFLRTRSNK